MTFLLIISYFTSETIHPYQNLISNFTNTIPIYKKTLKCKEKELSKVA